MEKTMAEKVTTQEANTGPPTRREVPPFFKAATKVLRFFVSRNIAGPMGKTIMVITTTGRKSDKEHSVPIGYLRDKGSVLAFTLGGTSDWYKNVLKNPQATLQIKGKKTEMRGESLESNEEVLRALETYKRDQPKSMTRFFGVSPDGSPQEMLKARERVRFIRFYPVKKEAR